MLCLLQQGEKFANEKKRKTDLRETDKMTTQLMQTLLYVGDGNQTHKWKKYNIFSTCEYDGKGIIKIKFSEDVTPLFWGIKNNFTKIPIGNVVTMKSKYSILVYQLIMEK